MTAYRSEGSCSLFLTDTELAQVQVSWVSRPESGQLVSRCLPPRRRHQPSDCRQQSPGSPDGELHQVVDLVTPDKAAQREALELHDEHVGQAYSSSCLRLHAVCTAGCIGGMGHGQGQQSARAPPPPAGPSWPQSVSSVPTPPAVKRLRHWSSVKWPARAASPADPGSSAHSSSLGGHQHEPLQASLLRQTRARLQLVPAPVGRLLETGKEGVMRSCGEPPAQSTPGLPRSDGLRHLCPSSRARPMHQFCR